MPRFAQNCIKCPELPKISRIEDKIAQNYPKCPELSQISVLICPADKFWKNVFSGTPCILFVFCIFVFWYFGHCWVSVPLSANGFLLASFNYQLFADVCISYLYFVSLYFCILATVDCWCHYQHLDSSLPLLIINCHLHFHQSSSPPI